MAIRRLSMCFAVCVVVVSTIFGFAQSASAAVPVNDDIGGAVAITPPLPFTYSESTVDATTSPEEAAFNSFCGAPKLEHGVWFTATPTTNEFLAADVTGSDYSAGILVLTGSPGNLTPLNCAPGVVSGPVQAGVTYYLLVFGDGFLTTATSGNLVLKVSEVAPPPTVSVSVNKFGSVDKQGDALISGTVTCASTDGTGIVVDVFGSLRQTVGRIFIDGFFDTFSGAPCDNSTNVWQAVVVGTNGKFAGGRAANLTFAVGCTLGGCTQSYVEATVQLRRNG